MSRDTIHFANLKQIEQNRRFNGIVSRDKSSFLFLASANLKVYLRHDLWGRIEYK